MTQMAERIIDIGNPNPHLYFGMTTSVFDRFVTEMHLGPRLHHPESWPGCQAVKGFKDRAEAAEADPLYDPLLYAILQLPGRPMWVCLSTSRWFGTNCGRPTMNELLKPLDPDNPPEKCRIFQKAWHHKQLHLTSNNVTFAVMHLDDLLGVGPSKRDRPTPQDAVVARQFMRWLDSPNGLAYLFGLRRQFKETYIGLNRGTYREVPEGHFR